MTLVAVVERPLPLRYLWTSDIESDTASCEVGGVPVGLDGLNPWSKNETNHSMWPIVLGQLNLPRNVRYHLANPVLVRIIPSQVQGAEPKSLDYYYNIATLWDSTSIGPFYL